MGRDSRQRREAELNWPPANDDVQVMDLKAGRTVRQEPLNIEVRARTPPAPRTAPGPRTARLPAEPSQRAQPTRWATTWATARPTLRPHLPALLGTAALLLAIAAILLLPSARSLFRSAAAAGQRPGVPGAAVGTDGGGAGGAANGSPGGSASATAKGSPSSGATAGAARTAYLAVRTQPAGATVLLDGKRLGVTPATVPQLEAGEHTITIRSRTQTVEHRVQVSPGEVVSLLVPLSADPPAAAATAGRTAAAAESGVSVEAPVELRVYEDGALVGTSQMARIPLAAGVHHLQLRSDVVGYQEDRVVSVTAGRTAPIQVELPQQRVAINALPWAEVWVDGSRVGETPIGSLSLPLGPHTVVLRHPQLGERTVQALVKANEPTRISADLRSK